MRRTLLAAALTVTAAASLTAPAAAARGFDPLPLGPSGLHEERSTERLARGVTLTTIVRGAKSEADAWTLHLRLPVPGNSGAVIAPKATAKDVARRLAAAGFQPRVEPVNGPRFADVRPGVVGYTVRVGRYATEDGAKKDLAALTAKGFKAGTSYTAQDGGTTTGPWRLHVLTVDPRAYRGEVVSSTGGPLSTVDKVSDMVRSSGAVAGVNGTYFTSAGKGGSAGLHVVDGKLLSEADNGRTAMILPRDGRRARIAELSTDLRIRARDGASRELDGVNRVPGQVDNCGGVGGDLPTERPQHDVVCADPDELVAFTPEYGPSTPAGEGAEAVLDRRGRVTEVRAPRGGPVPAGGRTVQAVGTAVEWLRAHARPGTRPAFSERVLDRGRRVRLDRRTSILGAGPRLVRDGRVSVNAYGDGLVHTGEDRSFYYNWVLRRNPRTMAGVDARGRLLFAVADGRAAGYSEGLSIEEAGKVMRSLGAVQAMNFDGGGSSAMATARSGLVNRPSDAAGERLVGDAVLLTPR